MSFVKFNYQCRFVKDEFSPETSSLVVQELAYQLKGPGFYPDLNHSISICVARFNLAITNLTYYFWAKKKFKYLEN